MPAVPHHGQQTSAPQRKPRNPNVPAEMDTNAYATTSIPSYQPSPAVLDTSSHALIHALSRRFLGPLPPEIAQSTQVQAKQSRLHRVRLEALNKINGVLEAGGSRRKGSVGGAFEGDNEEGRIRGRLHKIRVLRRGRFGEDVEEEFEFDPAEIEGRDGDLSQPHGFSLHRSKNKGKGKGKEKWEGESFDIGREFTTSSRFLKQQPDGPEDGYALVEEPQEVGRDQASSARPSNKSKRPTVTPQSTQESFVTARTTFTHSPASTTSRLHIPSDPSNGHHAESSRSVSSGVDHAPRHSQDSSSHPLLGEGADDSLGPRTEHRGRDDSTQGSVEPKRLKRLKSAIRKSGPNTTLTMPAMSKNSPAGQGGMRSKSVTFPVDPVSVMGEEQQAQAGDKPPEDPEAVLAREGSEAEGTSAGAQESALEEEAWDEEETGRGVHDVIMRGETISTASRIVTHPQTGCLSRWVITGTRVWVISMKPNK
jgi:hypothetical protein